MFRMSSLEPVTRTHDVREMARRDSGSVVIDASFNRVWDEYVIFRVTIVNATASRVAFNPLDCFFTLSGSPGRNLTGEERTYGAVEPEAVAAHADQLLRTERSIQAFGGFIGLVSSVVELAADLTDDGQHACSHTEGCSHCRAAREREEEEERERSAQAADGKLATLSRQLDEWNSNVLRRASLGPRESADGMIAFPRRPLLGFRPDRTRRTDPRVGAGPASRNDFGLVLHLPVGDATRRFRFAVRRF